MTVATLAEPTLESVETLLRDELAQGDAALSTAAPILRHLLVNEDRALFSDEVVARVRGMLADIARQLLHAQAEAGKIADRAAFVAEREADLTERMAGETALLAHLHALTIEARLALQLQTRSNVDPVLCPLLQELVASRDDAVADSAMAVLATQARFIQHHRRMALPLGELPGDLLHTVLLAMREEAGEQDDTGVAAERHLRDSFDESRGRLGLTSRLVMRMGKIRNRVGDGFGAAARPCGAVLFRPPGRAPGPGDACRGTKAAGGRSAVPLPSPRDRAAPGFRQADGRPRGDAAVRQPERRLSRCRATPSSRRPAPTRAIGW